MLTFAEMLIRSGLVMVLMCMALYAPAQPIHFVQGPLTRSLKPLLDLSGDWKNRDGETVQVPFCGATPPDEISRSFTLADSLLREDSLYLYLEGTSGIVEVRLNGAFLALSDQPFAEKKIALPGRKGSLLKPGDNEIRLTLSDAEGKRYLYPVTEPSVCRRVWLLCKGAAQFPAPAKDPERADSIVIFPPYISGAGFCFDPVLYRVRLSEVRELGGKNIWFPFPPPPGLAVMAREMGFRVVQHLDSAKAVAVSHYYPVGMKPAWLPWCVWRDGEDKPTAEYGQFLEVRDSVSFPARQPDKTALVILFMIPFIGLMLIRVLGPRIYAAFPQYLFKARMYYELIRDAKYLKAHQTALLTLFQLLLMAVILGLFLYFVQISGEYEKLNILSQESLLYNWLVGREHALVYLFMVCFVFLLILFGVKNFILVTAAEVYRVQGLAAGVRNLDILTSFPLLLIPVFPAAFAFFWKFEYSGIMLVCWYAALGIWFLRRVSGIYAGFSYLAKVSAGLKILYICTFEILPWVFLI